MKNPGCANNRGSPPATSRNSSYQIPLFPYASAAMILKAQTACGDDDDSLSNTGLCSDFYVLKWVPTLSPPRTSESSKNPVNGLRQIAGLPRLGPIILRAIHVEPSRFDVLSVIKDGLLPRP